MGIWEANLNPFIIPCLFFPPYRAHNPMFELLLGICTLVFKTLLSFFFVNLSKFEGKLFCFLPFINDIYASISSTMCIFSRN